MEGWNKYGINWTPGGLNFAPFSRVVLTFLAAIKERSLVNSAEIADIDIDDLPFEPHLDSRPNENPPPDPGTTVSRMGVRTLVKIDQLVVGLWARGDDPTGEVDSVWVNFKDSEGDWNKSKTPPVYWNKKSLLEELGQDEFHRLRYEIGDTENPTKLYYMTPITSEWALQVYKLLNLFKWSLSQWAYLSNPFTDGFVYKRATGTTYADMVSNWPSGWTPQTDTVVGGDHAITEDNGSTVSGERVYVSDIQNHSYGSPTKELTRNDDLYRYIEPSGRWNNDGNDWLPDRWNKIGSLQNQKDLGHDFDLREFLSEGPTPDPHKPNESTGWFMDGKNSVVNPGGVAGWTVQKWDTGLDGFQYLDTN